MASTPSEPRIFSIGHSNRSWEEFEGVLRSNGVTALADVRSSPWSRRVPHFSKDTLATSLRRAGIAYVFLGDSLGGRPSKPSLYVDGVADYEKMAREPLFAEGIERVRKGAQAHVVALMCSERHPLDCHRCLLVGRRLAELGEGVRHIMPDGTMRSHEQIEDDLLAAAGLSHDDIFDGRDDRLDRAYRRHGRKIAFAEEDDAKASRVAG